MYGPTCQGIEESKEASPNQPGLKGQILKYIRDFRAAIFSLLFLAILLCLDSTLY